MAFPGLIRRIFWFFFLTQLTNPYGLRFISQDLYPPEVVNVEGVLAPEDWERGGPTGLGFLAGASRAGSRRGPSSTGVLPSPLPLSHPDPWASPGRRLRPHPRRPLGLPRPFLRPKIPGPALLASSFRITQVAFPLPTPPLLGNEAHCSSSLCRLPSATCFRHQLGN